LWVVENIYRWKAEQKDWFRVELVPDVFLPDDVFEEEGGASRERRSSVFAEDRKQDRAQAQVHPGR